VEGLSDGYGNYPDATEEEKYNITNNAFNGMRTKVTVHNDRTACTVRFQIPHFGDYYDCNSCSPENCEHLAIRYDCTNLPATAGFVGNALGINPDGSINLDEGCADLNLSVFPLTEPFETDPSSTEGMKSRKKGKNGKAGEKGKFTKSVGAKGNKKAKIGKKGKNGNGDGLLGSGNCILNTVTATDRRCPEGFICVFPRCIQYNPPDRGLGDELCCM